MIAVVKLMDAVTYLMGALVSFLTPLVRCHSWS
jgi:hypothetical protein